MNDTVIVFKLPKNKAKAIYALADNLGLTLDVFMSMLVDLALLVYEDNEKC